MIDLVRRHSGAGTALIEPHTATRLRYDELLRRVADLASWLRTALPAPAMSILAMDQDVDSVLLYLAGLEARIPACLIEPAPDSLARLEAAYAPALLLLPVSMPPPAGYREASIPRSRHRAWVREASAPLELHPDLALLLTTSGSTGSPKLVRLTSGNLAANATAISEFLAIDPDECAIASLPMHYSYGLSVLNSHLVSGASVVLTPHSFIRREFWQVVDDQRSTSFAGVPYMYETMQRLRYEPVRHPTLRTYTQAGGPLKLELAEHFRVATEGAGARLFVMYGQTEATARISYVPPERLAAKPGSIGIAIPRGRLRLEAVAELDGSDELVYEGANVMMGYADGRDDLATGDRLHGILHTGDLGRVDDEGYFRVVGRLKRFAKLFGRRLALDDVEQMLETTFPVSVVVTESGDRIVVHVERLAEVEAESIGGHLSRRLAVPPAAIEIRFVAGLPRTVSGKKDYRALGDRSS